MALEIQFSDRLFELDWIACASSPETLNTRSIILVNMAQDFEAKMETDPSPLPPQGALVPAVKDPCFHGVGSRVWGFRFRSFRARIL